MISTFTTSFFVSVLGVVLLCSGTTILASDHHDGNGVLREHPVFNMAQYRHQMKMHQQHGSWEPIHPSENPFASYTLDEIKGMFGLRPVARALPVNDGPGDGDGDGDGDGVGSGWRRLG